MQAMQKSKQWQSQKTGKEGTDGGEEEVAENAEKETTEQRATAKDSNSEMW